MLHLPAATGPQLVYYCTNISQRIVGETADTDGRKELHQAPAQIGGRRELADRFDVSLPAQQGSGSQPVVLRHVIDLLEPGPQTVVQLHERKRSLGIAVGQKLFSQQRGAGTVWVLSFQSFDQLGQLWGEGARLPPVPSGLRRQGGKTTAAIAQRPVEQGVDGEGVALGNGMS